MLVKHEVLIRIHEGEWKAKVPAGCIIRGFELGPNGWFLIYDTEEDDDDGLQGDGGGPGGDSLQGGGEG